jgi:hypothetical protein
MTKRKEKLPYDPAGYSVNRETGTIHTRYAGDHAGTTLRTRTARGVDSLLAGAPMHVCRTCYSGDTPEPQPAPSAEAGQVRRVNTGHYDD